MGRPRTQKGTFGKITTTGQVLDDDGRWINVEPGTRAQRWRARTRYRDTDGKLRDVERYATTKAKAEAALKAAVVDRKAPRHGETLRSTMTLQAAGEAWLQQIERPESNLSANTRGQYAANWRRYIDGSDIAGQTLAEMNNVRDIRKFLEGVADAHGAGAAKTARSILSGILTHAVNDKAQDNNAARQVRSPKPKAPIERKVSEDRLKALDAAGVELEDHDTARAFTREERDQLAAFAQDDPRAGLSQKGKRVVGTDVADLVAFLCVTGARISEALAVRWDDVDLKAETVHIRGTKTDHADRVISLASWVVDILKARREREDRAPSVYVFGSPATGKLRDRRSAARALRGVLDRAGFPWATPHSFRRTVASLLDDAGMPIVLASNVLGHSDPAMTARYYLGRRGDTSKAASVL